MPVSLHAARFPRRRLAIVTCMDCRISPLLTAGLEVGEAHIIRNAGAIVTADVRRSLALSQRAFDTKEVWIVMHTDCGVMGLDDDQFLDQIESEVGLRPDWTPGGFDSLREGSATESSGSELLRGPGIHPRARRRRADRGRTALGA